jgi:AcrR family transcriptional regulator
VKPGSGRSAEATRERIALAATREFAARGYSGARVDAIAKRARINKRMLYAYFGNKEELFKAILRRKMREKSRLRDEAPARIEEALPHWFDAMRADPEWVRLMQWEGLGQTVVLADERRRGLAVAIDKLRAAQRDGRLSPDLDAPALFVTVVLLCAGPAAFPQLAELALGARPTTPAFARRWKRFLADLAAHLAGPPRRPA